MALFSGASFVIMAAIIRAVTIMTSGPDGAVSGSKWACRETFVSIVVANLPIIQPLIRRGAQKVGLSGLFSSSGGPSSYGRHRTQSFPLGSRNQPSKRSRHPLSIPNNTTAWGSDEHILVEGSGKGSGKTNDITVTQEMIIERGRTALHYAVQSSRASLDFIQMVVEAGTDLLKEDHSSKTPLHNAAQGRGREVISFLVERATDYANRYQELEKDVKKGTVAESPANIEIELDFRKMD
ncbi:hypothetical protein APSETT445_005102 [Aspergillus pseudonomiae]